MAKNTTAGEQYNSGPLREQPLAEQWRHRRIEMHQSQLTAAVGTMIP